MQTRAADNTVVALWQLQARMGIKPDQRRLPDDASSFERDLEVIRQCMERQP